MGGRCVLLLFSIHYVLKAEQFLKKRRLFHQVVPVPREIGSDCGMAIEFSCEDLDSVRGLLAQARIDIARIYRRETENSYREIIEER